MRVRLVIAVLLLAGCGRGSSVTSTTPELATLEQMQTFCDLYETVYNQSRQEMMTALLEVAPPDILGPIKRASELGGSIADDEQITAYLKKCRR